MHILLICDPGHPSHPSRRVAAFKDEFTELLHHDFESEVTVDVCTEALRVQADYRLDLSTLDAIVDRYPAADLVIMLTAIPRHTQGKPLIAEVLPARNIAVISYPTLGALTTKRRLLKIYMSCVNQLLPEGHLPAKTHHLSTLRLISIGIIAIAVMVGWLITINRLWDRPVNERLAQVVFYYNLSTVLTLIICVTGLYALLVIGILAGGLIVIDPEFMAQTIHRPEARLTNYLDIAWLSAAMGVVAGALGSSFDSDIDLKNLTHAQRLRSRVYIAQDDETGRS